MSSKCVRRRVAAPEPAGELPALPDSLAGLGEGKGWKGWDKSGKEVRGKEGKGREKREEPPNQKSTALVRLYDVVCGVCVCVCVSDGASTAVADDCGHIYVVGVVETSTESDDTQLCLDVVADWQVTR